MSEAKVSVDDLSVKEQDWLEAQRRVARALVEAYTGKLTDDAPTIDQIDGAYEGWLAHVQRPPKRSLFRKQTRPPEANDVAIAIGVALGDRIIERTGLEWRIITDPFGTDLGLYGAGAGEYTDVVTHPMNAVAKRIERAESGWLPGFHEATVAKILEMLG